jgi:hypothetical protein
MFLKFRRCRRLFQLTCFASSCVGYSEARFVWSSGPNLTIGLPSTRSVKRQGYIPDGQMHGRAPTSRRARISSHTTEARRSCVWVAGTRTEASPTMRPPNRRSTRHRTPPHGNPLSRCTTRSAARIARWYVLFCTLLDACPAIRR